MIHRLSSKIWKIKIVYWIAKTDLTILLKMVHHNILNSIEIIDLKISKTNLQLLFRILANFLNQSHIDLYGDYNVWNVFYQSKPN